MLKQCQSEATVGPNSPLKYFFTSSTVPKMSFNFEIVLFRRKKTRQRFQNVIFETNLDDQMKPKVVVDDNSEVERGYNEKKHSTNG